VLGVEDGALTGTTADGSVFVARLPFARPYVGPAEIEAFVAAMPPPDDWGVLLVRKGGFAVARMHGVTMVDHKIGQRHVQGRTKAGGQSQQRFARRRANQARVAYEAAASHAARILAGTPWVVTGGDHAAVEATLADAGLAAKVDPRRLDVPDPRRVVLDQAVRDACSATMRVTNA
jgi:hypothetical protein